MIPKTIDGLPLHPLIIHATVVLLPLAALAVLFSGLWPRARRYLHVTPLVLSVLAVILLALSYASGNNLKDEIGSNPLIARHEHLAHQLLIPVLGLVVAAFFVEVVRRQGNRQGSVTSQPTQADAGSTVLVVIAAVLAVVFAVGTTVQTVRVGEAGARAVWGHSHS